MHDLLSQRELPTVLLIDDDLISREVAATVLTLDGYTVHTAADGKSALETLAGGSCVPEVILVDAQMPGLAGAALITKLRARSRAAVVAVSGSLPPEEVRRAADGFLSKPFNGVALEHVLAHRLPASANPRKTDSSDSVISPETLAQLRRQMPESGIREIYAAVTADLGRRLTALEAAISRQDMAEVRRIGHAIKGGCGMVGALEAARLGALLEALPTEPTGNHLGNSARLLSDLRAAARDLERILASELSVETSPG
jgi:CheY-like chemotaxis protein